MHGAFGYSYDLTSAPLPWWSGNGHIPDVHILACPRVAVADLFDAITDIKLKWIEALEHEQRITHCCRHPENHDISAWYSTPKIAESGCPDVYHFHCTCGKTHTFFCVGENDERPWWEIR